ncbi:MAG: tetratricopeptide repeat protein [Symploca sp. SIO2E9]|nr:tetratricopeptide repeat protein [Symploca sp. SIO2E9]
MANQSEPIVEASQLLYLGQLSAAIRLAESLRTSPNLAPQAILLQARCLTQQGQFRQADVLLTSALSTLPTESEVAWEMRLQSALLKIYLVGNPTPICKEAQAVLAANSGSKVKAISQDLLGRTLAIRVTWNLAPPSDLVEARFLLSEAFDNYHHAGESDAALAALLKQGQLFLIFKPEPATAASIFQQASEQAQIIGNQVRQAEAALRLAELDFDAHIIQRAVNPELKINPAPYQQALALYEAVGHGFGPADVLLSLGSRLSKAGFDGTDALQQALSLYEQTEYLTGIYKALTELSTWHLQQGELSKSFECRQKAVEVAKKMDFPLAQATALLGIGDYYYRIGHYARALAVYEQVETLATVAGALAMKGLNLANAYILMNLPERAEAVCCRVIKTLKQSGSSKGLSLSYFILGNVISGKGDWAKAIPVWRKGLAVDKANNYQFEQAEKLKCIAQATVMQHHHSGSFSIPEQAYQEAMTLYTQATDLLSNIGGNEALAAIADIYQLQGQTAVTYKHSPEALQYLEQARNTYAALGKNMQTAITDALLGLVCHDLGNQGYPNFYAEASRCCEQALEYFRSTQMREMSWKVCFYLADIAFMQSFQGFPPQEQEVRWHEANGWLEKAATDIELVRGRFIETDPVAREHSRLGLVMNKEKVYKFAIKLHHQYLENNQSAFNWLERLKGRAFLDSLALTPLRSPASVDEDLLNQEQELLKALSQATTQAEAVNLSEDLHTLWQQMAKKPSATEYVSLRRGQPSSWKEIKVLLQQ